MKLPEVVLRKSVITFFHTNDYNSAFTVMREVVKTGLQKCPRVIDELTVHFNDKSRRHDNTNIWIQVHIYHIK